MKGEFNPGSSTIEEFYAFMKARHEIWRRRDAGLKPPWTDDPVLRTYKFTNIFRQLDRGTLHLKKLLAVCPNEYEQIFCIFKYRMINLVESFPIQFLNWDEEKLRLRQRWASGEKTFTSAHMTVGKAGESKLETTIDTLDHVRSWLLHNELEKRWTSLERCFQEIKENRFFGIGPFINYEIVCDLRFIPFVWNNGPTDVQTWANLGPGAKRGLRRLGLPEEMESMRLLFLSAPNWFFLQGILFELREIEHSLCEFDKYCRGGGKEKYDHPHV